MRAFSGADAEAARTSGPTGAVLGSSPPGSPASVLERRPARRPERRRIRVTGVVQGVGFRPFVHSLAARHGLAGFVLNDDAGVLIEVEGMPERLDAFGVGLVAEAPPLARVAEVRGESVPAKGLSGFAITASRTDGGGAAGLPPDVATCDACLTELFDPADRRHRHPFITCTDCGPRYTIIRAAPYDRRRTTMAGFPPCAACAAEYRDPRSRRFHAEAICCRDCGPTLSMPLEGAIAVLAEGGILAVKGLGGYHLACDASDEGAVARLRLRKRREEKPFALMARAPGDLVVLTAEETAALLGPARPIVLARRRAGAAVAPSVAPGLPWLGVMLPYTPVHHLLLAGLGRPLVMTSANRSDAPIIYRDDDARERLRGMADAVLGNDRPIHRRCEDSVVRAGVTLRRARGLAPAGLPLPVPARRPTLGVGAEQKNTVCLAHGAEALMSPHLGDLGSHDARAAFREDVALLLGARGALPEVVACDLHPGYAATGWAHAAAAEGAQLVEVQHHHAHAAACLAENGRVGPALALVFDGTGLGTDGTLWGGELLRCDLGGFERLAALAPVPMPGGEAAVREPWRMAAAYLEAAGRPVPFDRWPLVRQALRLNAPRSSGMGRLFDAVAALLGVRERSAYEGQAAMELEALAGDRPAAPLACRVSGGVIHGEDLVRAAHDDVDAGRDRGAVAAAFHEGVAVAAVAACAEAAWPRVVALSGGSFQNRRLLRSVSRRLRAEGFTVITHRAVPPNDGGLSYGQAAVAAERTSACA